MDYGSISIRVGRYSKSTKHLVWEAILPVLFIALCNCSSEEPCNDYFPIGHGMKWVYEIQVYGQVPMRQELVRWLTNGSMLLTLQCDRLGRAFSDSLFARNILEMRVSQRDSKHAEIEIAEDGLGIFKYIDRLCYIVEEDNSIVRLIVWEPATIWDPRGFQAFIGSSPAFSDRVVFFMGSPGQVLADDDAWESITFLAEDERLPGFEGKSIMRFLRVVRLVDEQLILRDGAESGSGFTEEMWYEKGRGLVRLEQRVDDTVSMVWRLISYSD